MRAMVLHAPRSALRLEELADPAPGSGEIRVRVEACAVCRTDLHVVDGELPNPKLPIIPGHEIVGRIDAIGAQVSGHELGRRVGIPWLGHSCGHCLYCLTGHENLCDQPQFTGYTRDGGFATHLVADARFAFDLASFNDPVGTAPLMCAGLIGWRSLLAAGPGASIGIYGFGAAAHIIAQVCRWQGRKVFGFVREGDERAREFARSLGVLWAGYSSHPPPEPLDAAIIFAPVGELVPIALRAVRKGGRVVCGGIHMSDIPSFPYSILWEERQLVSVANLTRRDAREFLRVVPAAKVRTTTVPYELERANEALSDLRDGRLEGAAVLCP
ncbi:MAG: zinc-dependent alcohol dehydrogenase family protein [Hyphomicrobiales bacterium]|nr:zinc-dependent alcohol dehydrogenase family protein [Hyphomicrobiales bacterium]